MPGLRSARIPRLLSALAVLLLVGLSARKLFVAPASSGPLERTRRMLRVAPMPGEARLALQPGRHVYPVTIPPAAQLQVGFGTLRGAWTGEAGGLEFTVVFRSGDLRSVVFRRRLTAEDADHWHDVRIGLESLSGRSGQLELDVVPSAAQPVRPSFVFWSTPFLTPQPPRDGTSVLLMSIDTLRADHLGCYGYGRDTSPNIDRLAREGVLFRQAVSASTWTLPSHASMFTGLLPSRHGAVRRGFTTPLRPTFDTLAELLWDQGYRTAGFTGGGFVLLGLDQGFERYTNPGADTDKVAILARTVEHTESWMRDHRAVPFFAFFHTYAVHMPYAPPEPYRAMFAPPPPSGPSAAFDVPGLVGLYDGEIRHMDAVVGGLLDRLRNDRELAQRTCVILTADHGEEFEEHGALFHDHAKVYEELARVPLIVWCPSRFAGGRVIDQPVSLVDLLPTVLDIAGVSIPDGVAGRSLTPLLRGDTLPERVTVTEVHASVEATDPWEGWVRAFRTSRYKVIESTRDGGRQVFDLHADPRETRDIGLEPPVRAELAAALQSTPLPGPTAPARPATPDQATLERLRALGYMP